MKKRIFLGLFFLLSIILMSCTESHKANDTWQTDDNYHWHACSKEGCTEEFDKTEHSWTEWVEEKPATCKQSGEKVRSCTVCGKEEVEFTSKLLHTDDIYQEKTDENYHWLECPTCNQVKEGSKKEHVFTNYVANNDATCSQNGTETAKCEGCSKTNTNEILNSTLEHEFKNYVPNNDASCSKNGTETAKCEYCDEVHTREIPNSTTKHNVGEDWSYDEEYHFIKCSDCDYRENEEEHNWGEWDIVSYPTFDDEGLKKGKCLTCNYEAEVAIPVLVKADLIALNATNKTIHAYEEFNLLATIGPASAENYRIEWLTDNNEVVTLVANENECKVIANDKLGRATITLRVINELNGEDLYVYDVTCVVNVIANPIVKYTFDNGVISNSGTQDGVIAKGTTIEGNTSIIDLENGILNFVTGTNGQVNSALELNNQRDGGNHLSISNIKEITGDFTISVKVYLTKATIKTSYENYLFGTISDDIYGSDWANGKNNFPGKDPIAPLFNFAYASNQGRMQIRWYINGSGNTLQYIPVGEWVEIKMVKCGTTVTTYIDNINKFNGEAYTDYSKTIELSSPDQLVLRPEFILGLSSNLAAQNPGSYPVYYDDITIYDFATNHMFGEYKSNNDATCSTDGTETAKCLDCDVTHTRVDVDSKLPHSFINYISDNNSTCTTNCTETAKCDNCDATDTRDIENSKAEHVFSVYKNNNDGTETAKCDNCDATDTREVEISGCSHEFSSEYSHNDLYHWYPCLKCEEVVNPLEHTWEDATCVEPKTCSVCKLTDGDALGHDIVSSHYEEQSSKLVLVEVCSRGDQKVSEIEKTQVVEVASKADFILVTSLGYNVLLKADIDLTPEDGEGLQGLTISSDITIDLGGKTLTYKVTETTDLSAAELSVLSVYEANVKVINGSINSSAYGFNLESGSLTLTNVDVVAASNGVNVKAGTLSIESGSYAVVDTVSTIVLANESVVVKISGGSFEGYNPEAYVLEGYEVSNNDGIYLVRKTPIVRYTFNSGIVNEGTNSNVTASLLSNADATRYEELTDASYLIADKFDSTVLRADHNTGKSFGIKGIETGTGDFTISAKYAISANVENIYNKANQYYIMGTATESITGNKPAAPCFAITLGKDSKSAGYVRATVTLNGETKLLYVKNEAGYFKSNTLVEFRVVKEGKTVTVSVICPAVEGQAKCCPYSVTFELANVEDLMITSEQVLGFGCNYGANRPGNYSYYDDIVVYDYAAPFLD